MILREADRQPEEDRYTIYADEVGFWRDATTPLVWDRLESQLLVAPLYSFVIDGDRVIPVGGHFDTGPTVLSQVVTDLDGDGHDELVLSYSEHTGAWSIYLWSYEPATGEIRRSQRLVIPRRAQVVLRLEDNALVAYAGDYSTLIDHLFDGHAVPQELLLEDRQGRVRQKIVEDEVVLLLEPIEQDTP